jgi:hypothetical protein
MFFLMCDQSLQIVWNLSTLNNMSMQRWIIIQMDDGWNWLTKWNDYLQSCMTPSTLCLWMK